MSVLQVAVGSAPGTANDTATLTGVTAGSTIVAFAFDGNTGSPPTGVSDAQGAYTPQGSAVGPGSGGDFVNAKVFTLLNANAGTHAVQVATGGAAPFIIAFEMSAPIAGAIGTNGALQSAPGTGANALSSGSVAASALATLVAVSVDTHVVNTADAPALGTGFTTQGTGSNGNIGSWRAESKSVSSATAATATAIVGADNFLTIGVTTLEPSGASVQGMLPQSFPRLIYL